MIVNILHVEDDPFWSNHVANLVRNWGEFRLTGETTGASGIARCRQSIPDILLLDLRLPDMSGFSVLDALMLEGNPPPALLLSCKMDSVTLNRANSPHVFGMILKAPEIDGTLRSALSAVAGRRRYFSSDVQAAIRRSAGASDAYHKILSAREQEVVGFVASGHSDSEIAAILGISVATVHRHRQNTMSKLDIHSTPKLMAWAMEKGFV
ncbi:MAG: response regulator transcription factor [Verrucomicrobia bacterium]|nr:response regulator transcription factor [Verrucomicrobiota bacterium]